MRDRPDVLVVGAGVSGLTTGVRLVEAGLSVEIRTERTLYGTTSCAAGAMWGPYLVEDERVEQWCRETRRMFADLADPAIGVRLVFGLEAAKGHISTPTWAAEIDGYRDSEPAELPDGYRSGWWYTAPLVDMPTYLSYLMERFAGAGGAIRLGRVASLDEALESAPVVVNCAGLGARDLVPDKALTPTRGQLVVVDNPGIDRFFAEHDESPHPTYFLPHGEHVVLGGTAVTDRTDLRPDRADTTAIIERCARIEPALGRTRVLEERVGLRPTRSTIRVERVALGRGHVVHNYGHGGSGVTVSWGCAGDVLRLVREVTVS